MAQTRFNAAEVTKNLSGVDFPADKQALLEAARERSAPQDVIDRLNELPDREFSTPSEVMRALAENGATSSQRGTDEEEETGE